MASAIKAQTLHVAWGSGDAAWDALADGDLPSLVDHTALVAELGRRIPSSVSYVTPDDEGGIVVPVGQDSQGNIVYKRYSQVTGPTPYLYVRCNFDNADAANSTIREMGLFGGTVVKDGLPAGQAYFTPDQIADPGFMVVMQIIRPKFDRSPSVRESIEFVLPI
jgi:hypothetical protein